MTGSSERSGCESVPWPDTPRFSFSAPFSSEALGGTSKRYFTDVSYVYELTAPMQTVVDMTERDRTGQFAAPARAVR